MVSLEPFTEEADRPLEHVRLQRPLPQLGRPNVLRPRTEHPAPDHDQLVDRLLPPEGRVQLHQPRCEARPVLLHARHRPHTRLPPLVVRPHEPLLQVQAAQQPQPLLLAAELRVAELEEDRRGPVRLELQPHPERVHLPPLDRVLRPPRFLLLQV